MRMTFFPYASALGIETPPQVFPCFLHVGLHLGSAKQGRCGP